MKPELTGTPASPEGLHSRLLAAAHGAGFPLAGALDLDRALSLDVYREDIEFYDRWIADGRHATMQYLARGRDRRADPRLVFPEAKSILCVAWPYDARPAGPADPAEGPRYARYLRARDYHKDIAERLEAMMRGLAAEDPGLRWKVCVDTSAVLERRWAALAGLGWIGKNTLLIHPQLGSYLFLAEVFINRETGHGPAPIPNYCGRCTRCLDGCPTRALTGPDGLDSDRCISYHTLENRGPITVSGTGTWIAGCDVCQEVCPFNTKASRASAGAPASPDDAAIALTRWEELLSETEQDYKARVKESSLSRVKPWMWRRNLAIALREAVGQLSAEARAEFAVRLAPAIRERLAGETDPIARSGWERALEHLS